MSTLLKNKQNYLPFINDHQNESRLKNLNLGQNGKFRELIAFDNYSNSNYAQKFGGYRQTDMEMKDNNDNQKRDRNFSKASENSFNYDEYFKKNGSKLKKIDDIGESSESDAYNCSTLSHHFETFEDSVAVENEQKEVNAQKLMPKTSTKTKTVKKVISALTSMDPFHIPKQQENETIEAEVANYSKSQQLLNFNQVISCNLSGEAGDVEDSDQSQGVKSLAKHILKVSLRLYHILKIKKAIKRNTTANKDVYKSQTIFCKAIKNF
uniref:Uncharacterized protein n=1 Tax=Panagrolaimus davidi TaxID=227884 RepID=A0A914QGN0_9BILA